MPSSVQMGKRIFTYIFIHTSYHRSLNFTQPQLPGLAIKSALATVFIVLHDNGGQQGQGHLRPHWLQWWKRRSAVSSSFVPGPETVSPKCPLPARPRARPC